MGKANASSIPAQGSGSTEKQELFDHVVTKADLDANPDLVSAGVKEGETIQIPVKDDEPEAGVILTAETPEWVQTILDSNQALLDSNQSVIDSLDAFKENSSEFVKELVKEFAPKKDGEPTITKTTSDVKFDPESDYEVAPGKSFRDPKDFTKEYTEGDDVTHLGAEKLLNLLSNALVQEA